ncbi:MAG: hypothetical protein R3A78_15075 [Polyangiales bacterium]
MSAIFEDAARDAEGRRAERLADGEADNTGHASPRHEEDENVAEGSTEMSTMPMLMPALSGIAPQSPGRACRRLARRRTLSSGGNVHTDAELSRRRHRSRRCDERERIVMTFAAPGARRAASRAGRMPMPADIGGEDLEEAGSNTCA